MTDEARDAATAMLLWCPECRARHIDVAEFAIKFHHTHACQSCGHVWRPAVGPTVGVQFLPGFQNAITAEEASMLGILGAAPGEDMFAAGKRVVLELQEAVEHGDVCFEESRLLRLRVGDQGRHIANLETALSDLAQCKERAEKAEAEAEVAVALPRIVGLTDMRLPYPASPADVIRDVLSELAALREVERAAREVSVAIHTWPTCRPLHDALAALDELRGGTGE